MKNKIKIIKIILIISIILLATFIILMNLQKDDNIEKEKIEENKEENAEILVENKEEYLIININPKIMLKISENKIVNVFQLNSDATIYNNETLSGLGIEEGITKIIMLAKDNKYIDDNTIILLSIYSDDNTNKSKVNELVISTIMNSGVKLEVIELNKKEKEEIRELINNYSETEINNEEIKQEEIKQEDKIDHQEKLQEKEYIYIQNLDINKIFNIQFTTQSYFYSSENDVPKNYNSFYDYWGDMITKHKNKTLESYIRNFYKNDCSLLTNYYSIELCNSEKEEYIKKMISDQNLEYMIKEQKKYFYGNYQKVYYSFYIYPEISKITSSIIMTPTCYTEDGPIVSFYDQSTCSNPNWVRDFTLTSDINNYYLYYNGTKCTANNDLIFRCEYNHTAIDDYTGETVDLSVFYPTN